eukprot:Nk52_evm18s156 gene=Nk52_evmTU18s156
MSGLVCEQNKMPGQPDGPIKWEDSRKESDLGIPSGRRQPEMEMETSDQLSDFLELKRFCEFLKDNVKRLNIELSRYHSKYPPLALREKLIESGLSDDQPIPPWWISKEYLSPLLLAYDEKIAEKDEMLEKYETELTSLKGRVQSVIEENEKLYGLLQRGGDLPKGKLGRSRSGSPEKVLAERNSSAPAPSASAEEYQVLLEENRLLMHKLQGENDELRNQVNFNVAEITTLTRACEEEKKEKSKALSKLKKAEHECLVMTSDLERAMEDLYTQNNALKDYKQALEDITKKYQKEITDAIVDVNKLTEDQRNTLQGNKSLNEKVKELQKAIKVLRKTNKVITTENQNCRDAAVELNERDAAARQHIKNLVDMVEQAIIERDKAIKKLHKKDKEFGRLFEKLRQYKKKTTGELNHLADFLKKQEQDKDGRYGKLGIEIEKLRLANEEKQREVDVLLNQKRNAEDEMDRIFNSAKLENSRLQEICRKHGIEDEIFK